MDWYSTLSTAAILAVLAVASGEFGSVLDMVDIVLDGRADGIGQARILEGVQASLATFALGALVVRYVEQSSLLIVASADSYHRLSAFSASCASSRPPSEFD